MFNGKFLADEKDDLGGRSRRNKALCCAIIEDSENAREFEIEPRAGVSLPGVLTLGTPSLPYNRAPLPRELTNLIS